MSTTTVSDCEGRLTADYFTARKKFDALANTTRLDNEEEASPNERWRHQACEVYCQQYTAVNHKFLVESRPEDEDKIIRGPLDYLFSSPGKDVRGKFMSSFNEWLHIPAEKLEIIGNIVKTLHTASLLIDDIQDSSRLRRGSPVAHSIFGIAQTINSANYAYFLAQENLRSLQNPRAHEVFVEELLNLHRGQGMDIYWRDTLTCPSEKEYMEMVSNKTGGLFRLAIKLMQGESNSQCDCVPLTDLLGIIFQIRDDILNLESSTYTENKGYCEDITEGKFSFPIIHSIRSNKTNLQLINILKQKSDDDDVKHYAVEYITSTGSLAYSHEKLAALFSEAQIMVDRLDQQLGYSARMHNLLSFLKLQ